MAIIGDPRVSTDGQSVEAQVAEAIASGACKVFQEKVSGALTDRAALKRAVTSVQAGDSLLVTRLDRLARSTRDLLNILDDVAKRGGGFRSLRPLGRHDDPGRAAHGYRAGRPGRVRMGTDPRPDR